MRIVSLIHVNRYILTRMMTARKRSDGDEEDESENCSYDDWREGFAAIISNLN